MPTYQITGPDGKKYRVTGENPEGAFSALQEHIGSKPRDARDSIMGKVDATMRGAADTLSFGLADEIAAQARSGPMSVQEKPDDYYNRGIYTGEYNPLGAIARTLDAPWSSETKNEDYDRALAEERAVDAADTEERGGYRFGGQIAGGLTGGVGLAKNGLSAGVNAAKRGASLGKVAASSAGEGAILGAAQGYGSGEGIEDRLYRGGLGMVTGLGLGGTIPYAVAGASKLLSGVSAPVLSHFYPDEYAQDAIGSIVRRSGQTPDDVTQSMVKAIEDRQANFTVEDALGNAGGRALSTVARTPNPLRQELVDVLISRQMDQGRRVASDLTDAAGTPWTAERYGDVLKTRRAMDADANYGPVKRDTSAIDVSRPVDVANRSISPVADNIAKANEAVPTDLAARASMEAGEASIRDPIRLALKEARSYLASDKNTVTNVEKAFRAKTNIDAMIEKATKNGQGGMVAELIPVQRALDDALANTSKTYAGARDAYRVASGNIEAIDAGREMARPRNRVDDNIANFRALTEDQQKAARVGYFDPQIAKAEQAAGTMTNSARPFVSESARRELPVFAAPGEGERLMRRLAREQTMSETTGQALGGSRSADNLADQADMGQFDPSIVTNMLKGGVTNAVMGQVAKLLNTAKGMPPSVLERVGKAMLETDPAIAKKLLDGVTDKVTRSAIGRAMIAAALRSSLSAGAGRLPSP